MRKIDEQLEALKAAGMHWAVIMREDSDDLVMGAFYIHHAAEIFVEAMNAPEDARIVEL